MIVKNKFFSERKQRLLMIKTNSQRSLSHFFVASTKLNANLTDCFLFLFVVLCSTANGSSLSSFACANLFAYRPESVFYSGGSLLFLLLRATWGFFDFSSSVGIYWFFPKQNLEYSTACTGTCRCRPIFELINLFLTKTVFFCFCAAQTGTAREKTVQRGDPVRAALFLISKW